MASSIKQADSLTLHTYTLTGNLFLSDRQGHTQGWAAASSSTAGVSLDCLCCPVNSTGVQQQPDYTVLCLFPVASPAKYEFHLDMTCSCFRCNIISLIAPSPSLTFKGIWHKESHFHFYMYYKKHSRFYI